MNQEVKKLWVDALRSGEYQQGKGSLRNDNKYCCLGVLCDLAVSSGVCKCRSGIFPGNVLYRYDSEFDVLPDSVIDWAELESKNPAIRADALTLGDLNDSGRDFIFIADRIEKYL